MTETSIHNSSHNQSSQQTHVDLTQNPTSVYYLQPSDHASTKRVNIPFDGNGLGDSKRSVMIGLIAKNKLCVVDGTLRKPSDNASHMKAWERCNDMVLGWLIASLNRVIAKSMMYNKYASEIWTYLKGRFGVSTFAQIYSLHEELSNISQEANMSITEYFTKVKSLWDELHNLNPLPTCVCNGCSFGLTKKVLKLQQDQRLMSFLTKVDDQYSLVKTNIFMLPELPHVSTAYRICFTRNRSIKNSLVLICLLFLLNQWLLLPKKDIPKTEITPSIGSINITIKKLVHSTKARLVLDSREVRIIIKIIVKLMVIL